MVNRMSFAISVLQTCEIRVQSTSHVVLHSDLSQICCTFKVFLYTIFTFGRPTCVPNFSPIETCVSDLQRFLYLCKTMKKTESLVICISEVAGMIYFKFGM